MENEILSRKLAKDENGDWYMTLRILTANDWMAELVVSAVERDATISVTEEVIVDLGLVEA